ncbi:hypothetical protein EB796_008586 [Bugula neritina]|uniref:Uncharacterized protein n=1 Tax=Bugula neritina TaxID=10212 RepID=A0A7J7K6A0_BUGNE|nr:hypothetical protein EB796_008586 [Bugula neritina]
MPVSMMSLVDTLCYHANIESQYEDLSFGTKIDDADADMTIIADGINYVAVDVGDLRDFDSESDITIVAEETTYYSGGE